jgi:hypothetical protein|tara:strand:+ start:251 stop:772 length:522 start_codon:yes stop_codon:yes gene_type:complete
VADIQKLKELGDLHAAGILTQDEFEKEKDKILNSGNLPPSSGLPPPYIDTVHTKQTQYNSPPPINYGSDQTNNTPWIIGGVIAFVILLIIIFSMGGSSSTASVSYSGCWAGAFSDGDFNIISIDGCGNQSFDCGSGGYCGINAQKQDDSSARLCVSVGSDEACTTAAYGVASV